MEKENKGFTLIELLAVIVILAVIALIVTPIVTVIISKSKASADLRSVEGYVAAANDFYAATILDSSKVSMLDNKKNVFDSLPINGKAAESGNITIDSKGHITMSLILNNKCYTKSSTQNVNEIEVSDDVDNCVIIEPNAPELSDGMIPVLIADNGDVTKADVNSNWYNYNEKKWANMVLVNNTLRDSYISAAAGSSIIQSDILGYFVWIPRYRYQLFNVAGGGIEKIPQINIKFESKDAPKQNGTKNGEWLTHPGFTFGSDELSGIWVAKYETTGDADTPTILPNLSSLRNQKISDQFATSQKLNNITKYGINSDSHMAKNSEWGAIAYLSHSKYGRCSNELCEEVSVNNSSSYITGSSAGRPADEATSSDTVYSYNTSQGYLATTTGNIMGIYDMSGGSWEFVMGVLKNNSGVKYTGYNGSLNSGFNGIYDTGTYSSGVNFPDEKYYQSYYNNQLFLGEATIETKLSNIIYLKEKYPWFMYGGCFDNKNASPFQYGNGGADAHDHRSFRIILAP